MRLHVCRSPAFLTCCAKADRGSNDTCCRQSCNPALLPALLTLLTLPTLLTVLAFLTLLTLLTLLHSPALPCIPDGELRIADCETARSANRPISHANARRSLPSEAVQTSSPSTAVPPHDESASLAWHKLIGAMDAKESGVDSRSYETRHVHRVYDQIAYHFSSTRYKVCASWILRRPVTCFAFFPPSEAAHSVTYARTDACYSHGR